MIRGGLLKPVSRAVIGKLDERGGLLKPVSEQSPEASDVEGSFAGRRDCVDEGT